MLTDYKIVEEREESGSIVYQRVRFYEGQEVERTAPHPVTGELLSFTSYERTAMYEEKEYFYE